MRKFYFSLPFAALLLVLTTVPAAALHYPEPAISDNNASFLFVELDLDGEPLANGDEIGIFDPDGVCAGLGVVGDGEHGWIDGRIGVPAWGDDRGTDLDEGFESGDLISYHVWDSNQEIEMIAQAEAGQEDGRDFDTTWASNSFNVVALHARGIALHRVQENEHDFGVIDVVGGETAEWQTEIENIGNAVLQINGIEGEGNWRLAEIAVEDNQIEPDSSTNLTATFPGENYRLGDNYSCIVYLATNTPDSLIHFHFTGRIGAPINELNRNDIFFGRVPLESELHGTQGWAIDSVVVWNRGDATLLINNIHCTAHEFSIPEGDTTAYSLPPRESQVIKVIFRPGAIGDFAGRLTYESNSPTEPSSPNILLHGVGIAPVSVGKESTPSPCEFSLSAVYPNPFNGAATIRFSLPVSSDIHLVVYDLMGAETAVLAKGAFSAGEHYVVIESKNYPAGIYVARLRSGRNVAESRFVVVK